MTPLTSLNCNQRNTSHIKWSHLKYWNTKLSRKLKVIVPEVESRLVPNFDKSWLRIDWAIRENYPLRIMWIQIQWFEIKGGHTNADPWNATKTRRWTNVGLLLGHRLRRWPNSNPTLVQVNDKSKEKVENIYSYLSALFVLLSDWITECVFKHLINIWKYLVSN